VLARDEEEGNAYYGSSAKAIILTYMIFVGIVWPWGGEEKT
jgi:hypothetical protein